MEKSAFSLKNEKPHSWACRLSKEKKSNTVLSFTLLNTRKPHLILESSRYQFNVGILPRSYQHHIEPTRRCILESLSQIHSCGANDLALLAPINGISWINKASPARGSNFHKHHFPFILGNNINLTDLTGKVTFNDVIALADEEIHSDLLRFATSVSGGKLSSLGHIFSILSWTHRGVHHLLVRLRRGFVSWLRRTCGFDWAERSSLRRNTVHTPLHSILKRAPLARESLHRTLIDETGIKRMKDYPLCHCR